MLVDRNAVEAELGGELELVEIAVVELVPFLRIEVAVRQDHPGGAILVGEVHVQVGIGHEMKHEDFHRAGSRTCSSPRTIVRGSGCFTSVAPTFAFAVAARPGKWIRAATARGPALQAKPFLRSTLLAQPPTR